MKRLSGWMFGFGLLVSACGTASSSAPSTVEIFSWWTYPGEAEALQALVNLHTTANPNVTVVNAAAVDAETARNRLATRLQQGNPPDLFQANGGADLRSNVLINGRDEADSRVESLDTLLGAQRSAFPPAILDSMGVNGHVYGIPINVHRINVLFFNTQVLARANVRPPTTLAELDTACTAIEATGVACFAFPASEGWGINIAVLSAILVAEAGGDYYEAFMRGRGNPSDPPVRHAAETYLRLLTRHSLTTSSTLTWSTATEQVFSGRAAFTVMGDWAKGFFTSRGSKPGIDFGSVPFPGTTGSFVFTTDAFLLPRGARNRAGALSMLTTCLTPEAEVAFNLIKGSIPARLDVDVSRFDSLAQATIRDLRSDRLFGNDSGYTPPAWRDQVNAAAVQMVQRNDPMVLVSTMVAYYDLLQR